MEKAKKYLWKKIIEDLKNSNDEKLKNTIKAFDSEEDLKKFIQFYCSKSFDDMKRISSLCYFIRKEI
jgi:4-alpha-glucanotransferase